MKDKIFGVLQRVGRSFMLPIALLPVAGLLLGIGSSFTNETMLAAYGLNSVIHPGTPVSYTHLDVYKRQALTCKLCLSSNKVCGLCCQTRITRRKKKRQGELL